LTTELQSGLATAAALATTQALVDDLEGRLTAQRAEYLDNLSLGFVALEETAQSILTDTGTTLDGKIDVIDGNVDDIEALLALMDTDLIAALADTNELQGDWVNGGRLDLLVDAIKAVTDLLTAAQAEPTGVPAANATPLGKLGFLFAALRNKLTVTSAKKIFFDDAGAALWEKDLVDDGTTYQETEGNAP
jgi:hypothetical protein